MSGIDPFELFGTSSRRTTKAPRVIKSRRGKPAVVMTPEETAAAEERRNARATEAHMKHSTLSKGEMSKLSAKEARAVMRRHAAGPSTSAALSQKIMGASLSAATPNNSAAIWRKLRQTKAALPRLQPNMFTISTVPRFPRQDIKGRPYECLITEIKSADSRGTFTLDDPRMGPCRAGEPCDYCTDRSCPGKYGYIRFARPIINPIFLRIVIGILKVICYSCSSPLEINISNLEKVRAAPAKDRLGMLEDLAGSSARCPIGSLDGYPCEAPRDYKITQSNAEGKIMYTSGKDANSRKELTELSVADIERVFNNMSEETAELLGFTKEKLNSFIMDGMYVPPRICRPSHQFKGLVKPAVHQITNALVSIIDANKDLEASIDAQGTPGAKSDIGQNTKHLYWKVSAYIDHINALMQGKDALVRGLVVGKRGDFTARAVIVPAQDDTPLGWIEIPRRLITKLSRLEDVTPENIASLQRLVYAGEVIKIEHKSGKYEGIIRDVTPEICRKKWCTLNIGDKINRKLRDGDWVVMFRPPSIHRHSISAYRARILDMDSAIYKNEPRNTVGVHLSDTTGKNADFDGDAVMLSVPQSEHAIWEAENVLALDRNIMSSQTGTPIVAMVMNSISNPYRMTQPGIRVEPDLFNEYLHLMKARSQHKTLRHRLATVAKKPIHPYSGRALFSALLPEDFEYTGPKGVVIVKGILVKGVITKADVGPHGNGSIVHKLHTGAAYGWQRTSQFITDAVRVFSRWGEDHPMSVGMSSIASAYSKETRTAIEEMNNTMEDYRASLGDNITTTELMNITDKAGSAGLSMMKAENAANIKSGKGQNPFYIMSTSGAKGSEGNTVQIFSQLGLQLNSSGPMPRNLTGGRRCMTTMRPDDYNLEACGFIGEGLAVGMRPNSMYMASWRDREPITDTATKLPAVGDAHRKASLALGKIAIYNNMVSDASNGSIYEYLFGGDGLDATETMLIDGQLTFIDIAAEVRKINARNGWILRETVSPQNILYKDYVQEHESLEKMMPYYPSFENISDVEELELYVGDASDSSDEEVQNDQPLDDEVIDF